MAMNKRTERLIFDVFGTILYILLNIIFYMAVIYVITKASKYSYDFAYQIFGSAPMTSVREAKEISLEIKKGDSTMAIGNFLEQKEIIKNKYSFYLRAKLAKSNILPGKYKLKSSMDYDEIFGILTNVPKEREGVLP